MSQATVSAIVPALVDEGLAIEAPAKASGVGRPPTLVDLDRASYIAVGLKIMQDRIVGAVTDLEATTIGQSDLEVDTREPAEVAERIAVVVRQLLDDAGLGPDRVLGVGVGLPGIVDTHTGICLSSPLPGWSEVPVEKLVAERTGLPVRVDNDVNTLALAERWFGSAAKASSFVVVTLGRGIGFAYVGSGTVLRGGPGSAGEFGHTVAGLSDDPCTCGNRGCIEATVAEPALLAKAAVAARSAGLTPPRTAAELYAGAKAEPALRRVLTDAGAVLGRGVSNLVNLFAPELVIISGEGAEAGDAMFTAMRAQLADHVHPGLSDAYAIAIEPLHDETWAWGAASLVLDAVFDCPMRATSARAWRHATPTSNESNSPRRRYTQ